MKTLKTLAALGVALSLAGAPALASAADQSPQKMKTGVGDSAGSAAGLVGGGLGTVTIITGLVVAAAVGIAIAASSDGNGSSSTNTN
jgi:hypothetical protein